MRPPKPRISKKHLHWAWDRRREEWQPYHRVTWTEGGKRRERAIKLDWQGDPRRLDELFWACESGRHERQQRPARHTWGDLIPEWRGDPRVQSKLAQGTKRSYGPPMDRILEKNAGKPVASTTRQALRAVHASLSGTPRKADRYLQTVSLLWNYAKNELDWPLGENPASGIKHFGAQREYLPWPDWLINKLPEAPDAVQAAAELILGTGQRPNAAISMEHTQFLGDTMMIWDEKGKEHFEIDCPKELRSFLEARPKRGRHVIAKNLSEPLGYDAIEKQFRAWRNGLGAAAEPYSFHGLRKLAIIRLAEAGWSDAEIQAATNQSVEMVAYYRRKADRVKLTRNARERNR